MAITKLTPEEFLNFGKVATNSAPKIKKLSANEWLEYGNEDKNKSFLRDMWSGHVNNVNKYYSSVTKGLSKGAKNVGLDKLSDFLGSESTYSSYIANKENKKINNQIAGLAGDIIGDPLNLFGGLGIVNKANKLKKASTLTKAKEISKGAGVLGAFGAGASALRDYGDDSVKNDEMFKNMAIGGVVGAGLGGGIVSGVPQHYFKKGYDAIKSKFTRPVPLPKANITPYDEALAKNQAQNSEFIKGDGFRMQRDNTQPRVDYDVKITMDDWVKELADIKSDELSANLYTLRRKHPRLFKKPSDVYKTMIEVKNNPTHFFKNNRPDMGLITKRLRDNSLGKVAIVKDSGVVGHVTKSTRKNELNRLYNVNRRELGVGSPYPTPQSTRALVPEHGDGVNTLSPTTSGSIIPNQSLNHNITKDDILKEIANLRNQGFKFGNDMDENLNLVLNKIKNDRLNATNNTQMPNNELLPPINQLDNPNIKDDFITQNATKKTRVYKNFKRRTKRPSKNKFRKRAKYYLYKRVWQKLC